MRERSQFRHYQPLQKHGILNMFHNCAVLQVGLAQGQIQCRIGSSAILGGDRLLLVTVFGHLLPPRKCVSSVQLFTWNIIETSESESKTKHSRRESVETLGTQ